MLLSGFDRQLNDVIKTYSVRSAASELTQSLTQAEANQRGYLLTGDGLFLQSYRAAASGVDIQVNSLLAMAEDDPEQKARLAGISGTIAGKLAEMARAVDLVAAQQMEAAQTLTESGLGARMMAEVIETLNAFVAEENNKLDARNSAIDQTRMMLAIAMLAAVAAAAILSYSLLARTQREVSLLALRQQGLLTQNTALEQQVAERTREFEEAKEHAERERDRVETLLQDTNHRVGNSLATVSSLLALQGMRSKSEPVKAALEAARSRVHAVASAHRRLRLGDDFETTSAHEFLSAVIEDITMTQPDAGRVIVRGDIEPIEMAARDATTLGILVGELITNALKHGFPEGRTGEIVVSLHRGDDGVAQIVVEDDGVGLDETGSEDGLGSVIVKQLAIQFGSEPDYSRASSGGLRVSLPLLKLEQSRQTDI